jgi:transcriptional regulator with XRE-family HTH domain
MGAEEMRLGELIAVARECKGMTLRDLEKVSGVSNSLISQIETHKIKNPGFTTVVQLCDALGVSLDRAASGIRARFDVLRKSESGKRKIMGAEEMITIDQLRELTALQAEDECLWAPAKYIETGYTQQALRYLTMAIEGDITFEDAKAAIQEMMP